jgi:hypothetical protein
MLSEEGINAEGFALPTFIENKSGLGLRVPEPPLHEPIDLARLEKLVGADHSLEVIDVESQRSFAMPMSELRRYFAAPVAARRHIYNVISLEISRTRLVDHVKPPAVLDRVNWITSGVWPDAVRSKTASKSAKEVSFDPDPPQVYRYCLISAANSYTDFHIDFGGSSVWYHLVKGKKIFYLIEPTEANLLCYENWLCSVNNSELFLADSVYRCFKLEVGEGQTIFLPTGWIHAVYTPEDSIVFGGNFLQSACIPLQIKYLLKIQHLMFFLTIYS